MKSAILGIILREISKYRVLLVTIPASLILLSCFLAIFEIFGIFTTSSYLPIKYDRALLGYFDSVFIVFFAVIIFFFADIFYREKQDKTAIFWKSYPFPPYKEVIGILLIPLVILLYSLVVIFAIDLILALAQDTINLFEIVVSEGFTGIILNHTGDFIVDVNIILANYLKLYLLLLPVYGLVMILSLSARFHPIWYIAIYTLFCITPFTDFSENILSIPLVYLQIIEALKFLNDYFYNVALIVKAPEIVEIMFWDKNTLYKFFIHSILASSLLLWSLTVLRSPKYSYS